MFRHYCVILGELAVSTLPSYTRMSMQLLVIQFKIPHMFYAVEISMFKIFKILKLSNYTIKYTYRASNMTASPYRLYIYSHNTGLHENYKKKILAILL
jgi:hypothetical protein